MISSTREWVKLNLSATFIKDCSQGSLFFETKLLFLVIYRVRHISEGKAEMKKRISVALVLIMTVLAGCSGVKAEKRPVSTQRTEETSVSDEPSDTTTSSYTGPYSEPRAYSKCADEHEEGVVRDGRYFIPELVFDEDKKGFTSDIYEYVSFDERDLEYMNDSYFLTIEDCCFENDLNVSDVNTYCKGYLSYDEDINNDQIDGFYLKKGSDGFHMFDMNDVPVLFPYEYQIHLEFSDVISVYSDTDDRTFSLDEITNAKDTVSGYRGIQITVKDGLVSEICVLISE